MRSLSFRKPTQAVEESVLSIFEEQIGSRLPEGYRRFIVETNGGGPAKINNCFDIRNNPEFHEDFRVVEVDLFYHLRRDDMKFLQLDEIYKTYLGRIPSETIAIATDPFGNEFLLGIRPPLHNMVFFWDHECEGFEPSLDAYHNVGKLADSFEEFVDASRADDLPAKSRLN